MMGILLLFAAALLPAALLWVYVWKKDQQPEPTHWLLRAVMSGVVICLPVALLEVGIETILFGEGGQPSDLFGTTVMAFFVAAVPEESFKLLALWLILRKNPFFDEHYDGIVYAVCVGLGFAALENLFYVLGNEENWIGVAVARALLAVPGHYAFAVFMGYYYSVYHFVDHSPKVAVLVLAVPIVVHGIYDSLAMSGMVNETVGGISAFVLIYFCVKMHKFARTKMLAQIERDEMTTFQV